MIDFNYDITQYLQAGLVTQITSAKQGVTNPIEKPTRLDSDDSANITISENVASEINNLITKEDVVISKYNTARTIYEKLGLVRGEIADIIESLHSSDKKLSIESLEEINNRSNELIENVVNIIKEDNVGILSSNHINSFIEGMNFLKTLDINDKNYLNKIKDFMNNIKSKQNYYFDSSASMYNGIAELNKKYEALLADRNKQLNSDIQKEIINDSKSTLESVTKNITPENVMRLLNP